MDKSEVGDFKNLRMRLIGEDKLLKPIPKHEPRCLSMLTYWFLKSLEKCPKFQLR